MNEERVFSPRLLAAWVVAAALAFACSLYFMGQGDDDSRAVDSAGANSFSRSAIGYAGITETLHRLGIRVIKSQHDSLRKLGGGSVLVIAEPRLTHFAQSQQAARLLREAKAALLVLPKWQGRPSERHSGWIADAKPVAEAEAMWALTLGLDHAKLARQPAVERWGVNELGITPEIVAPIQLVQSDKLRPVVATANGVLLGEFRDKGRRLFVLADPDVMANHGLGRKANAAFAVALIDALRGENGAVVFDETVHGFLTRPATPLKLLFEPRFASVSLQVAIAIALLLWAAMARFGRPVPAPPSLDAGKRGLIVNAAKLITFAGHQAVTGRRYVDATIRDVALRFHAPRGLDEDALIAWLRRVGQARAVGLDCAAIWRRARDSAARGGEVSSLVPVVRDIYLWKQEIINGAGGNPRARRGDPGRSPEGGRRPG